MKPTGVQEDYLAKLLTKLSDTEMKQVIQKKLYQENPPKATEEQFGEDLISEALVEVIKGQDYIVSPVYDLPPEYRVPNLVQEIDAALETDTENKEDKERTDISVPGDEPEPFVSTNGRRRPSPKHCRICAGMHLEPMVCIFIIYIELNIF